MTRRQVFDEVFEVEQGDSRTLFLHFLPLGGDDVGEDLSFHTQSSAIKSDKTAERLQGAPAFERNPCLLDTLLDGFLWPDGLDGKRSIGQHTVVLCPCRPVHEHIVKDVRGLLRRVPTPQLLTTGRQEAQV